jgi:phage repressor protein C with HTH and peptisase S24 domain
MFTHADIWAALDYLAESSGMSASGLARRAGLDATAFNRSKRTAPSGKARWPSTESLSKVLDTLDISFEEFGHIARHRRMRITHIQLIGAAQAGGDGYFDDSGFPAGGGWDAIALPGISSERVDENMYALEIAGDSMAPAYRPGDKILVSPNTQARRGDRVVVKTRGGEVMAKELGRSTEMEIELISLNPEHEDRLLKRRELEWIARIMWVTQ